jgi:hypothetical protein
MDYFRLFFNGEFLNNIVIETDRYVRHQISELQLTPTSIWSMWSDVSVPEVKGGFRSNYKYGSNPIT